MADGEQRICPRCGAPIDATKSKCPYCLTSYFDISCIDINDHEPFYLKFRRGGVTDGKQSFKAVSNEYLLKYH